MTIQQTEIPDIKIISPRVFEDERGYFFESFREELFKKHIGNINFIQENESFSKFGTLRGLHYQLPPFAQSKLVRIIQGKVLDVAVDVRKDSPTFGEYVAVELSAENKKQLFIPRGFAHGFVTLSDTAIFQYKVDSYYNKETEAGIIWNDTDIGIDWLLNDDDVQLSEKDKTLPNLGDTELFEYGNKLYE